MTPQQQIQTTTKPTLASLLAIIIRCYQMKGLYFQDDYTPEQVAEDTYGFIMSNHPNISMEIINEAFLNGIQGRYGEVFGLPPTKLSEFVDKWYDSKLGINVPQTVEEEPVKALQRDITADRINYLCEQYKTYYDNKAIEMNCCGPLIVLLWSYGMCLHVKNKEVQKQYMDKAREVIIEDKNRLMAKFPSRRKDLQDDLDNLFESAIKEKSFTLIILDFFKDCKEMDIKDLHDLFNK